MSKKIQDREIIQTPCWTSGEIPKQYPWLSEDVFCDVCVIGGGITGAICALKIAEKGHEVALITDKAIGFGATSLVSSAVENDFGKTLTDLTRNMEIETAIGLYNLGYKALDELENLCNSLDSSEGKSGFRCNFKRRDLLLFTDDESELELLNHEYLARKHNGFDCTYITRDMARDSFSFDMCGGILSKDSGGNFNPYNFTHLCLMRAEKLGAKIFEHTLAAEIETSQNGGNGVKIKTSANRTIYADNLVLATGSEGIEALISSCRKRTLYTIISKKIESENESGWPGKCVIRTFSAPYINYSFTPGGRVLTSGLESRLMGKNGKIGDFLSVPSAAEKRFSHLEDSAKYLFPAISSINTEFQYENQYCIASDGLPLIGEHPDYTDCIFALCSGSNMALYSILAAQFASDIIEKLYSDSLKLFDPSRRK